MVLTGIIPQPGVDPKLDYRWRIYIASLLGVLTVTFSIHVAFACGLLANVFPALSGFALASDVQAQEKQLSALQMNQLDSQIIQTRQRQCEAMATNNQSAKVFAEYRIQQLMQQWESLSQGHSAYRIPDCNEL